MRFKTTPYLLPTHTYFSIFWAQGILHDISSQRIEDDDQTDMISCVHRQSCQFKQGLKFFLRNLDSMSFE